MRLAQQLAPMLDADVHLWFGVEYLPGVKDIDLIVWDEKVGVFAIEIKAFPIDQFESFNLSRCRIRNRKEARSPHSQAQEASLDLRNYLSPRRVHKPFVVATSGFPLIRRSQWNSHWDSHAITGDFAERILFQEDFESGATALRNRLLHIYNNPPHGAGSNQKFLHRSDQLADFDRAIAPPDAKPQPTPSDLERLHAIEREIARDWIERVPAFGNTRIGFTGQPGTGKTFRLLQIGANHAHRQAEVLYLCFNKVLAADIRRLLHWSHRSSNPEAQVFDVYDVFQLLRLRLEERQLAGDTSRHVDFESYGRNSVELLEIVRDEIATYDTVLLDEAQDLTDWQVRLAELHLKDGGTFAIGIGKGQELYGQGWSDRLRAIIQNFDAVALNRNFRNTREIFQAAFVAYDSQLDRSNIKKAAKRFRTDFTQNPHQGMLFDRDKGRFPILQSIHIDELREEDRATVFYAEQERESLTSSYCELVRQELQKLNESDQPIDLLILVPDERSSEAAAARDALRRIDQEYFDLTDDASRRAVVPPTAVRLCTFHSARGIEGNRVLVLGFARLPKLCESMKIPPEHLAYIVLSRSVFETVIAVRDEEWNSEPIIFMQEAIAFLQSRKG